MGELAYYLAQVIDGIAYGSIYGIFALSVVLLYRANKLLNFAQTEIATFLILIALIVLKKVSYPYAAMIMLFVSFGAGMLLHLGLMRFITERRNALHSSEVLVTIGLFTIFNSVSTYFFGDEPQPFPSPFGDGSTQIFGAGVSHHSIGVLIATGFLVLAIMLAFRYTRVGLIFEAVAENITAARLRGIRASNVLALAWGFTVMTSMIGASLIAPVLFVTPNMLISIFAYSLISVVIGGLESPSGALVGGIIVGVVENLASNVSFIGAELKFAVVALLLLIVLIVRPRGLWGRAEGRRL